MTEEETRVEWTQWVPPYDPRWVDGAIVAKDEHRRLIETADCGQRCPGCSLCCAGYRDIVAVGYYGTEEFEGNLKLVRGGLVKMDQNTWYRVTDCGSSCPGYGRCCPPFELRKRPETVADARRILLEDDTGQRWEMQESLIILAHEGSREAVQVLEAYMRRAHTRVAGFAECALDEGRFFASSPRNAEEARAKMKQEVREAWDERAIDAYGKIEELQYELERQQYELEIGRRLLEKVQEDSARQVWQARVVALERIVQMTENSIEEQQEEMDLCDAMVAEIEADLGPEALKLGRDLFEDEILF
jgi:hypothetical protein